MADDLREMTDEALFIEAGRIWGRPVCYEDYLVTELARRLRAENKVVRCARWACVAALDGDTDETTMRETVRPTAAQDLIEALERYDALTASRQGDKP